MSINRNDDDYINFLAEELVKEASKNIDNQPNFEHDDDFGLVANKPVYTLFKKLIDGEEEYLNSLYTSDGQKISWKRTGSISPKGISGTVDCYDTFLPSGEFYKTIYINMYGSAESIKVPIGFKRSSIDNFNKTENNQSPKVCGKCGKTNPADSEYCQFCGSKIEILPVETTHNTLVSTSKPKIDLGNDKVSNVLETSVIIACVVLTLILGYCLFTMKSMKEEITTLSTNVEFYETRYKDTQESLSEYKSKYYDIINFLKSWDAGYASSNYYASDSIVVLSKNGLAKSVTITCKYYNTNISCNNSNMFVTAASWGDSWYGNSIDITFYPGDTGTSIITFTNSYNSDSFRIMVIVV